MRGAEEHAAEVRRRAKRDLKELDPKPPTFPDDIAPDLQAIILANTLPDFEAELERVRILHTRAVATQATSAGVIQGKLEEAMAAQTTAEDAAYEEIDKDAVKVLKAATTRLKAATEQAEQEKKTRDAAQVEVTKLEGSGSSEPKTVTKPKTCPAMDFEFPCPVKKATFLKKLDELSGSVSEDVAAALDELLNAAQGELQGAEASLEASVKAMKAAKAKLETATKRAEDEKARAIRDEANVEAIRKTRERTQELEGQLLEAQAVEANGEGETAESLAERVERGRSVVEARRAWETQDAEYRSQLKSKVETECKIVRWDEIAKALKPDGIETKLGGGAKEAFMELLDEAKGLAGSIELTMDFDIAVHLGGAIERHPLQLSTSQRLAVGIAIQHAFASLIEFPILCCDAIDTFDHAHRSAWAAFAASVSSRYSGAVLGISTTTPHAQPDAPRPGFESYWLHDGSVTHLVAEKE